MELLQEEEELKEQVQQLEWRVSQQQMMIQFLQSSVRKLTVSLGILEYWKEGCQEGVWRIMQDLPEEVAPSTFQVVPRWSYEAPRLKAECERMKEDLCCEFDEELLCCMRDTV